MSPNKNKLISGWRAPFFPLDIKAGTTQLEDVAEVTFLKPKNAFGSKHILREFFLQKLLKFFDLEGAIALKRDRHKAIIIEMG